MWWPIQPCSPRSLKITCGVIPISGSGFIGDGKRGRREKRGCTEDCGSSHSALAEGALRTADFEGAGVINPAVVPENHEQCDLREKRCHRVEDHVAHRAGSGGQKALVPLIERGYQG